MGYSKIENLIRSRISATGITESNGFELLRLIRKQFSLMSSAEALSYREMCLKFRVKRTEHLLDIIREVESEIMWETRFCCIFEIYQVKSKSFCSCIRTLWLYNSWKQESRTITSELESKVTLFHKIRFYFFEMHIFWTSKKISITYVKYMYLHMFGICSPY